VAGLTNDIARVLVKYTILGNTFVNQFYFRLMIDGLELSDLAESWNTGVAPTPITELRDCIGNDVTIQALLAEWVRPVSVEFHLEPINLLGTGTSLSQIPLTTCSLLSLRSIFSGRSNRGRIYLPKPNGNTLIVATHVWSLTHMTNLNNFVDAMMVHFGDGTDWRWVVWSPTRNAAEGLFYGPPNVETVLVDPNPRTQRRRQNNVGA